jgi:hypothetical protein
MSTPTLSRARRRSFRPSVEAMEGRISAAGSVADVEVFPIDPNAKLENTTPAVDLVALYVYAEARALQGMPINVPPPTDFYNQLMQLQQAGVMQGVNVATSMPPKPTFTESLFHAGEDIYIRYFTNARSPIVPQDHTLTESLYDYLTRVLVEAADAGIPIVSPVP